MMQRHATTIARRTWSVAPQIAGAALAFALIWPNPASAPLAQATEVRIDHIEITAQYVTIHFYTDANRTYTLQATTNPLSGQWTDIYTARAFPFANHYVVADERTNTMRFYRLFVVP